MNQALCVGINDYPGTNNDLSGCINDAADWARLADRTGIFEEIREYHNAEATINNVVTGLTLAVVSLSAGDWLLFTYSGHGTYTVDMSGDESDGYDEALYLYDGLLIDDKIRECLKFLPKNAHAIIILDSCFSGTATRMVRNDVLGKPRFVQPPHISEISIKSIIERKKFLADADMVEILMSGCSDNEYSYDAFIDGRFNGAFTYNAVHAYKQGMAFKEWHDAIRAELPSKKYPQTPQLEGSAVNVNLRVFGLNDIPSPEPSPMPDDPEPEPVPWYNSWWVIALALVALVVFSFFLVKGW